MNPFQEKIGAWLSRTGPERSLNQCFDLPIVLATDIGLKRSENQDRVAALRIGAKASGGRPLIAIAVADGMGGMREGGKCATLALSSFFYALTLYRGHDIQRRANAAISYANDQVFKFAAGKGGATLSSVLLDHDLRPFIVNLGDSRVYAFGGGAKVERLTRDDSIAEAVGGHGRDLLQFVGMGEGMQPHVQAVAAGIRNLAITTDGIHFVEASTLESKPEYLYAGPLGDDNKRVFRSYRGDDLKLYSQERVDELMQVYLEAVVKLLENGRGDRPARFAGYRIIDPTQGSFL